MCDVVVVFTVYEDHADCLKLHDGFSVQISSEVMASWNDADTYCRNKGMQLLSINNAEYYLGGLECLLTKQQEGLNRNGLTVFVGLLKSLEVGLFKISNILRCKYSLKLTFYLYCNCTLPDFKLKCRSFRLRAEIW